MFLWVENFENIFNDHSSLIDHIDKTISTDGSNNHARNYQTHCHTHYCLRKLGACRFGFPYRECKETRMLNNIDISSNSSKGKFYELKRSKSDLYINAYNPVILEHWHANMDIQIIGNAQSAAYYVCAYICKSEPEDLKFALKSVIENFPENATQRQKMLKIGCCVLKSRRLSAQEAAYRLSNDLHLIYSSRSFISLCIKPASDRYRILKPKFERDKLAENSTDIFYDNIVDYYRSRPAKLETVCLYEFAQWYVKCERPKNINHKGRKLEERIQLLQPHHDIFMRKRTKALIVRLSKTKLHCDDYFYGLLMAFLPHRTENDILQNTDTPLVSAKEAFIQKHNLLDLQKIRSVTLIDEIENAVRSIRCSQIEIAACLNPSTFEIENNDLNEEMSNISIPLLNDINNVDEFAFCANITDTEHQTTYFHNLQVSSMSEDALHEKMKMLTHCQQKVMKHIIEHYTQKNNLNPIHIFISGSGGVGKSYLTKLIVEWLRICTPQILGSDPVVVCAPTGTAARNIRGKTIHSELCLPVQHGNQPKYLQLSAKMWDKLRKKLKFVHTIVIDEISMVSSVMLHHIHLRLCAIKGNNDKFGGLNVITIGDFFQLRPVRGNYVFTDFDLWKFIFKPFFLTQNVRQTNNHTYSDLLSRARVGALTKHDIMVLNSRVIPVPKEDIADILHLYPTKKTSRPAQ